MIERNDFKTAMYCSVEIEAGYNDIQPAIAMKFFSGSYAHTIVVDRATATKMIRLLRRVLDACGREHLP